MPFLDEDGVTRLTEDYLDIFALKNSLDATKLIGTVPSANLPSYVDDVLEYNGTANFPATGESGKIYVDTTDNNTYRWTGSAYVSISNPLDYATQNEAEAGVDNTKVMTPLRSAQQLAAKLDDAEYRDAIEGTQSSIAMIETPVAQSNHTAGSYFMLDNVLHKATSNIASGEDIVSGSNATPITIEQALSVLNSSVSALQDWTYIVSTALDNKLRKIGKLVLCNAAYANSNVTMGSVFITIPEGFRPAYETTIMSHINGESAPTNIKSNGEVRLYITKTNVTVYIIGAWFTA